MLNLLAVTVLSISFVVHIDAQKAPYPATQAQASQHPSPSIPLVVLKQDDTPALQHALDQEKPGSEGKPFRIALPPRDKYDWIAYLASLLLDLVGIGTLACLTAQIVEMRHQANLMKSQVDLMQTQNKIYQDRDRARLTIKFPPESLDLKPWEEMKDPNTILFQLFVDITNEGGMKAFNANAAGDWSIGDNRDKVLNSIKPVDLEIPKVIGQADSENPIRIVVTGGGIGTSVAITQADVNDIEEGKTLLGMKGEISYEDIFGNRRHTPFSYMWTACWTLDEDSDGHQQWRDESHWVDLSPPSD